MRHSNYIFTILLFINPFIHSHSQNNREWDFQFPININAVVSGSFGELRTDHFHSGVDFTTLGKINIPVYSIDEGHISRVVVSPGGYGKAIYIDHPNGYSSVYAHLNNFAPKIEAIITNLQYQKESFAIEEYFKPEELVVKKGELIAYSGNSGSSGGPHLHFEIRETDQQKPVNVHLFKLPVKDDVPPYIEAVSIYPIDKGSTINGKSTPVYLPVVKTEKGYVLKNNPKITASGTIGIGIETLDYFSGSWRKCGIYSILLKVNGIDWFESRLDGILFSQTRYINSYIDYEMYKRSNRFFQKSFIDINNNLDIYHVTSERGLIKMKNHEEKDIQYEIRDAAGNLSQLKFTITGGFSPSIVNASAHQFQMVLSPFKPHTTEIDGFKVKFPANSFYTEVPANFNVTENQNIGIGRHFTVLDPSIPVHNFFEITIPIPDNQQKAKGITGARINNENGLVFAGGKRDDNLWVINTRNPGVYCLTIDTIAPVIRLLQVPQNSNYSGKDAIRAVIKDSFSGIKEFKCTINGKWALFEYDAKNDIITGFFKKLRIEKGTHHELVITATDQTGNTKFFKTNFVY